MEDFKIYHVMYAEKYSIWVDEKAGIFYKVIESDGNSHDGYDFSWQEINENELEKELKKYVEKHNDDPKYIEKVIKVFECQRNMAQCIENRKNYNKNNVFLDIKEIIGEKIKFYYSENTESKYYQRYYLGLESNKVILIENHTYDLGGAYTNSTFRFIATILPTESFEETHTVIYLENSLEIEEICIACDGKLTIIAGDYSINIQDKIYVRKLISKEVFSKEINIGVIRDYHVFKHIGLNKCFIHIYNKKGQLKVVEISEAQFEMWNEVRNNPEKYQIDYKNEEDIAQFEIMLSKK